jgi:hypothetical protein
VEEDGLAISASKASGRRGIGKEISFCSERISELRIWNSAIPTTKFGIKKVSSLTQFHDSDLRDRPRNKCSLDVDDPI